MFKINSGVFFAFIVSALFFLISLFTLSDYGISWDEPIHFMRGQGYLHYFLTGEIQYENLKGNRSYYQNDQLTAKYFFESDSGHPPLNGILASFTNLIFYQNMGILGDVESHHLFNILIASFLIFIVVLFSFEVLGFFPALISGLALVLYPLFFGESRFNVKDPAEAAFFGLTIYAFWKAVNDWSWRWVIITAVAFGLGFSTKFNILFLPFILIPWAVFKIFYLDKGKTYFNRGVILALLISPVIILFIFIGSWPYLWANPLGNFLEIFAYYKQIGTGFNYQTIQYYLPFGFNSYPILWIVYTTPPYILFLSFIGSLAAILNFKKKDGAFILWLLWLLMPIIRVTLPSSSIYGGVRQIMEYIPAMALLSGLGAFLIRKYLIKKFPKVNKNLLVIIFLVGFFQISLVLIKLHPNENVYFNSFAGGLAGAKEKNIPSWGNSFGNAYHQAINWLNQNAAPNSRVALIQGTSVNLYKDNLRKDIIFNNLSWSGSLRKGEYLLELTHQSPVKAYPYAWDYVENVLDPVYEVKVDGVAIAKVWKNDIEHSKMRFQKNESKLSPEIIIQDSELILRFKEVNTLTKITIKYTGGSCDKPTGTVSASADEVSFYTMPDIFPNEFVTETDKMPDTIYYYFPVTEAKIIKFSDKSLNSCLFNKPSVEVIGFR